MGKEPFNKYLLSICYVPGTLSDAEDGAVARTDSCPAVMALTSPSSSCWSWAQLRILLLGEKRKTNSETLSLCRTILSLSLCFNAQVPFLFIKTVGCGNSGF